MQSEILTEPTFVGREQELEKLEYHLKQAIEGKGTTVFVSGETGVGKTYHEFQKAQMVEL